MVLLQHLNHNVPVLIITGENEIEELPDYEGLLGYDQYMNTPATTRKMLYEISSGSHSSAQPVFESVRYKSIHWLEYHLMDSTELCDPLIETPENASQFLTTIECEIISSYDINDDGFVDAADLVMLVVNVMNGHLGSSDLNYDQNINLFDILILSDYLEDI